MREALSSHLASSLQSREVAGERLRPRFATWSGTRTRFRSSINIWKKVRTVSLVKGGGRECGSRTSAQHRLQCTLGNVNNKHFVLNLSQFESPLNTSVCFGENLLMLLIGFSVKYVQCHLTRAHWPLVALNSGGPKFPLWRFNALWENNQEL